jgi:CDP-diglyceride synthetase
MEASEAPHQVRNAVALLWASLALTTIDAVLSVAGNWPEDDLEWGMWLFYAIATAANGYLIFSASRRKNWARIVLLIITAFVTALALIWPPEIETDPWWSILLMAVSTIADIVAMIWLFSGTGRSWFKKAAV